MIKICEKEQTNQMVNNFLTFSCVRALTLTRSGEVCNRRTMFSFIKGLMSFTCNYIIEKSTLSLAESLNVH